MEIIEWAMRFIATRSVSQDGNEAMAQTAADLMRAVGLTPRFDSTSIGDRTHINVIADAGPEGEDGLLMITHLDTVPPGDHAAWTETHGDPWRATVSGDRLYGLGSADTKVDLVCKLAALEMIDRAAMKRRVRIVGTFGEEIGLLGARHLVVRGETRGFSHALVSEPTRLMAVHAHKGLVIGRLHVPLRRIASGEGLTTVRREFKGRPAHSSTPQLGVNAIDAALDAITDGSAVGLVHLEGGDARNRVPALCVADVAVRSEGGNVHAPVFDVRPLARFQRAWRAFQESIRVPADEAFDPPTSVAGLNLASLQSHGVVFTFDLRVLPGLDVAAALERLEKAAVLELIHRDPPLSTPADSSIGRCVSLAQDAVGVRAGSGTKAACAEAGILAEAGVSAIVIGPGTSTGNIHRPNEQTQISELLSARDLYAEILRRFCIDV